MIPIMLVARAAVKVIRRRSFERTFRFGSIQPEHTPKSRCGRRLLNEIGRLRWGSSSCRTDFSRKSVTPNVYARDRSAHMLRNLDQFAWFLRRVINCKSLFRDSVSTIVNFRSRLPPRVLLCALWGKNAALQDTINGRNRECSRCSMITRKGPWLWPRLSSPTTNLLCKLRIARWINKTSMMRFLIIGQSSLRKLTCKYHECWHLEILHFGKI